MDVLELPRPVINFLRTISKEMNRYSLCWDIYGGSESVTLTLTWKINCDESDDEQLAKSRRQHQQQLNNLINMDLNSNIFTDNTSTTSNMNSTNVLASKSNTKQQHQTPSTPTSKTKQMQHSKLDKIVNQSSTSSNNCLFSSSSKNKQPNDLVQTSDSYDPYMDTKSKRNAFIQQQNKLMSRNYSAESNVFNTKYEEDLKELASNPYMSSRQQHQQHKSRRPKSNNHSLERVSSHHMNKENDKIYLDFNRAQSTNISDNDNDDDELFDKQPVVKNVYPKKILKYTRGKSLENFDHSINERQYENFEQHRYCQNCSHNSSNNNNNSNANQMSFLNNNRLYQQPLPPPIAPQQQYISRSDQPYYNPQQMYQQPLLQQPPQQYMIQSNQQQLTMHQQMPLPPPQPQYSNFNSSLIKISSNTSGGNNEKVCLNNQRLLLENFNPYQQSYTYQQQQQQQNYMQSTKPQLSYVQDFDQSDMQKQQQNYFKTTKQKSLPPSSNDLNRIVYSQTAMSKAATCSHTSNTNNNNNSSNTENNSDSSSSENLINATASLKKALPNPAEPICINSSANFANTNSTLSNNNNNTKTPNSNLVSSATNNNPWIRRNILTETKENIVSESTFSKMSTTNEVTDTSYDYTNPNSSNSNNNTNNEFHSTNVSLPIKNAQQSTASNAINLNNSNSNANNTSSNSSMHRVTFDPKLDK